MKLLQLEQGTPEWHKWRSEGLGGSDIGAIVLGDKWPFTDSRADVVFALKTSRKDDVVLANYSMRRGSRMEPEARHQFEKLKGKAYTPVCVQHDECDWMRVSLDGYHKTSGEILEIKCPNWEMHSMALAGLVPSYYQTQCQYQLLTTGSDLLWYVSFTDNKRFSVEQQMAIVEVRPDAELQATILEKGEEFWGCVKRYWERHYGMAA